MARRATLRAAGAADGSIIAAIIVTHTLRYQPSPPRSVPGPASIPRIRSTVTAQAASAPATSSTVGRLPGGRRLVVSDISALLSAIAQVRPRPGRKLIDDFSGYGRSHV